MSPEPFPEAPSLRLAPGTQVGSWQVVERHGHGAYGVVYRAVRASLEHSGPVALKLGHEEKVREMTERFAHLSLDTRREAVGVLDWPFAPACDIRATKDGVSVSSSVTTE